MRQSLLDLYELQQIDVGIREIQKRQESIPARLNELEAKARELRGEAEKVALERDGIDKELKLLDTTVRAEALKIKKWEVRLNDIRNQREYLALSREVESSKRANREAEEKILELMTKKDALDKQYEQLQDQLAEQEVDCATERESVQQALAEAETLVKTETTRREVLLPGIPKGLLRKYETVRAKRFGIGMVPVVDGCCQGCNMRLPPQLFNILQRGDTIEQCPSCQRVILWENFLPKAKAAGEGEGPDGKDRAEARS